MSLDFRKELTYRQTRAPVQLAHTIIPAAYRDREFYEIEKDRVFGKGWVCIGYTSQIKEAGQTIVTSVGGQPIFIVRDRRGLLHAYYNVCRHRGSQLLAEDTHLNDVIRCPYHAWGYSLEGRLLGTPYFKGLDVPEAELKYFDTSHVKEFCKEDYGLLELRVDTWGCFVFVCLDPDSMALSQWLGDLPERFSRYPLAELELLDRKRFDVEANWKLIAENFMEYYHLPWVHPELSTVSGVNEHHRYQGHGMYTGMCTSPLSRNSESALDNELPMMPGLNEVESQSAYWILIFPNIAMFLLPNHLFTLMLRPNGPRRTAESADLLVHPSTLVAPHAKEKLNAIFEYWDRVNQQDISAVERVQAGIQAEAYPGGRMCFRFEESIHRFQNILIDHMVASVRVPPGD